MKKYDVRDGRCPACAAALAFKDGKSVRDIEVNVLQSTLKEKGAFIGI